MKTGAPRESSRQTPSLTQDVFRGNDQNRDSVSQAREKMGKPPTILEEINRIMRLMPEQAE